MLYRKEAFVRVVSARSWRAKMRFSKGEARGELKKKRRIQVNLHTVIREPRPAQTHTDGGLQRSTLAFEHRSAAELVSHHEHDRYTCDSKLGLV